MLSSFERLIKDRVTSPLFSTFTITWILWNWKIFYLTLFVDSSTIYPSNKIEYITVNYIGWYQNLLCPILATAFLLFIVPYGEKYVYQSYLKFKKGRQKLKEESEADTLLSLEESATIRLDSLNQADTHRRQLSMKDDEIAIRDKQIVILRDEKNKLKIHYAGYGDLKIDGKWIEVTKDVAKEVRGNKAMHFTIQNNAFFHSRPCT